MPETTPFAFALVRHPSEPLLQLSFEYQGNQAVRIVLQESQLPSLLALVQKKIQPGHGTPISMDQFRPGVAFAVAGWSVTQQGDCLLLTMQAHLPEADREVTIPWTLSRAEAKELIAELSKAL